MNVVLMGSAAMDALSIPLAMACQQLRDRAEGLVMDALGLALPPLLCTAKRTPCNVRVWLKAEPAQAPPYRGADSARAAAVSWTNRSFKVAGAGLVFRMAG